MSGLVFCSGIENSYHAKFYCKFAKTRKMTHENDSVSRNKLMLSANAKLQGHAKFAQAKSCNAPTASNGGLLIPNSLDLETLTSLEFFVSLTTN